MERDGYSNPNRNEARISGTNDAAGGERVDFESAIGGIWKQLLGLPQISIDDNFFEVGGTSLLATVLLKKVNAIFGRELAIASVFEYTTIRAQARLLRGEVDAEPAIETADHPIQTQNETKPASSAVAIIGMTGRFPGADSIEAFWKNLCDGVESITFFDRDQLEPSEQLIAASNEGYVAARPLLNNPDLFDAEFFGVYPKEAAQMDPQHRILLECAWEVLERAGYDPAHTRESVGVFAGCSMNTYFMRNLADQRSFVEQFTGNYQVGNYSAMMGNDKDFLPTRISYKLNLHGPSMSVQSACSTALVAVAQACQSLLTQGCDMALAGAVSVTFPLHRGYIAQEGGLASLDGHCRPFDEQASGTVFGHGAGVVLLKRLDDAIADGDQVLAVIRGVAVNNDGSMKAGYTAPSVEGQAQVIARAQKMAGVSADSISYLEAHGTGTPLGDPIEVAALTKAFRTTTKAEHFCSMGTAKGNVGHLDVAAGATGLIKAVLQLEHRTIPGLLHFEKPNPHLKLEGSPFFVDRETRVWDGHGSPLRAGVSAFGVGGTNAHVIVEEAPAVPESDAGRAHQLLVWSAKTPTSLGNIGSALEQHFAEASDGVLADAAYTLQIGRSAHKLRRAVVVGSADEAAKLTEFTGAGLLQSDAPFESARVVFCFPGQGVQTVGMGRALYETEAVFRQHFDACDALLFPLLGKSLRELVYPVEMTPEHSEILNQTLYAQPAIFAFEYALAQLWISWGIAPAAMVGHSVGEYVAACLSGVLSLEDALTLLAARSRLMQALPRGSMLAVRTGEDAVTALIASSEFELDIAAVNGPKLCVVSGTDAAIDGFVARLDAGKIAYRRLVTSHAFHSRMLDPMLDEFAAQVARITFNTPTVPYASSLTGQWVSTDEVATPEYWVNHLRRTVRFGDAVRTVAEAAQTVLLEVGPSETLVQLMRQNVAAGAGAPVVIASQGAIKDDVPADKAILSALGRLWVAGALPDWQKFHAGARRKRVLLPTYAFDRKRYWVEPAPTLATASVSAPTISSVPLQLLSPLPTATSPCLLRIFPCPLLPMKT